MTGISYMVDEEGRKTAAVVDLRRHGSAWEDFYDGLMADSRAKEPRESLASVKRRHARRKANG
ncbi:MAG: hypothetical protein H8E27_10285 [Verrucomicrobia subdivision 3 bacterium]|nr:hypothetical protein [Limisphaerales bacterium]